MSIANIPWFQWNTMQLDKLDQWRHSRR